MVREREMHWSIELILTKQLINKVYLDLWLSLSRPFFTGFFS